MKYITSKSITHQEITPKVALQLLLDEYFIPYTTKKKENWLGSLNWREKYYQVEDINYIYVWNKQNMELLFKKYHTRSDKQSWATAEYQVSEVELKLSKQGEF